MSKVKIGLDAGHGGASSGTYSCNTTKDKLYEKDYCLELVKMVGERLLANGFGVFYTRTTDVNPGNVSERAKMCINAGCKYAVSIHFNGFNKESANGCEVFVPYAEKGAGIEVGYYNYLGKYFTRRSPFARSNNYSNRDETYDKKINTETRKFDAVTSSKTDYFGFIRTSWAGGLSADLLEVCFLTNKADFAAYTENKAAIADAIARSIVEGYGETYKGTVATEEEKTEDEEKYYVQAGVFSVRKYAEARLAEVKAAGFKDAFIKRG